MTINKVITIFLYLDYKFDTILEITLKRNHFINTCLIFNGYIAYSHIINFNSYQCLISHPLFIIWLAAM